MCVCVCLKFKFETKLHQITKVSPLSAAKWKNNKHLCFVLFYSPSLIQWTRTFLYVDMQGAVGWTSCNTACKRRIWSFVNSLLLLQALWQLYLSTRPSLQHKNNTPVRIKWVSTFMRVHFLQTSRGPCLKVIQFLWRIFSRCNFLDHHGARSCIMSCCYFSCVLFFISGCWKPNVQT